MIYAAQTLSIHDSQIKTEKSRIEGQRRTAITPSNIRKGKKKTGLIV
jgi:hypothetical protein